MTYTSLSLIVIYIEFLVLGRQGKCIKFDSILVLNCVSSGVGICTQDWCMRVQSNVGYPLPNTLHYSFETVFSCAWC